jgi:hypothetical protein
MSEQNLNSFLMQQDAPTLARVLFDLAADYPNVNERLQRLQIATRSDLLSKEFGRKMKALSSSDKYYSWREVDSFAQELQIWIDQVEREVFSIDPNAAVVLFESFIEADAKWFEMADDSGGSIGMVMGTACEKWLRAARLCEGPVEVWANRLERLHFADRYGARDDLMRRADLLLDETELQQMINRLEEYLTDIQAFNPRGNVRLHAANNMKAAINSLKAAMLGSSQQAS